MDNPFPNGTSLLVEDESTFQLALRLFNKFEIEIHNFRELVQTRESKRLSPQERLEVFETLVSTKEKRRAPYWLQTIESLREAMVLSSEDLEYCLSELPQTPKNKLLTDLFTKYLDSPLKHDWAGTVWEAIEATKDQSWNPPFKPNIVIVPKSDSSYVFQEFAKALPYIENNETIETKAFNELLAHGENSRRPLFVQGSVPHLHRVIAAHAKSLVARGIPPEDIVICFSGTPGQKFWLEMQLAKQQLPVTDLFENSSAPRSKSVDHAYHQLIRQDRGRPLKERLQLSAELLTKKAENKQVHLTTVSSTKRERGILLSPLVEVPDAPNLHTFYFIDPRPLDLDIRRTVFAPNEIEMLRSRGFWFPRTDEISRQQQSMLGTLLAKNSSRNRVFCPTQLEGEYRQFRPKEKSQTALPEKEYTVPKVTQSLSATQLESYARCPSQYFLSNRLKLRDANDEDGGFRLLFGSAVHRALEKFKGPGESDLNECFQLAVKELRPDLTADSAIFTVLSTHFSKLSANFLAIDKDLSERFASTPLGLEESIAFEIDNTPFRGKIDRIDRLPDGSLLVMDYKTGNVSFSPTHVSSGKNFQALLYLLGAEATLKAPIAGVLFVDLKKAEAKRGLILATRLSPKNVKSFTRGHVLTDEKLETLKEEGLSAIRHLVEKIAAGNFSPVPDTAICESCEFGSHCREGAGLV